MVRTYDEAVLIFTNSDRQETNLEDFFSMGGLEGVLGQCPDGPYTYRHNGEGEFTLHCKVCLENGCSGSRFKRVYQIDEHRHFFQANLDDAHFSHEAGITHSEECYCTELKNLSTRAQNITVKAIHTQIYLAIPEAESPRFFIKARKPDEITSKQWAIILRRFVMKNEDNFVDQESAKYFNYIENGDCPDWFVSQFTQNIELHRHKLEDTIYRINEVTLNHSSTAVWTRVSNEIRDVLKSEFSIEQNALICAPLSPSQNGKIGFTNSSVISEIFTLMDAKCQSYHPTSFKRYNDDSDSPNQNESYICVDFGGLHLHFSLFKKLGSEKQSLFESVVENLNRVGKFKLEFNHREIKVIEFRVDYDKNTAIFFIKPNQKLKFILRQYNDSNDLRGKSSVLDRIRDLNVRGNRGSDLVEEYAAKINSSKDAVVENVFFEGERYVPVGFHIGGSGILEIQSDDGLTYQKIYTFEGDEEGLSLSRMELNHDYASEMVWSGALDPEGYTPPQSLEKSEQNTGARIVDMLRHNDTIRGSTGKKNRLISLGFQNKVLDKSIGSISDLNRTFSERMEITRRIDNHKKFIHRKGLAIGGKNSEYLLFIDNRPVHKLDNHDVKLLRNGCRLIQRNSQLIEHHINAFPDLLMYPKTPEEFLAAYLDEENHSIEESTLEENYEKLQTYMKFDSETNLYFMKKDLRFEEGIWSKGIEDRSWTLRRPDVNPYIWNSNQEDPQESIRISSGSPVWLEGTDSTFQLVRTYTKDEDEQLFNPHIHQFYLIQYRVNKKPLAHKIFSNASDDVSFYPNNQQEYFNVGNVDDKRFKRYQFLNDIIRAMYMIMNKIELAKTDSSTIIQDILWYNIPSFLTRWLPYDKSPLSLLREIKENDKQLAEFLEQSIEHNLWINS
jgi:hypothetical protein